MKDLTNIRFILYTIFAIYTGWGIDTSFWQYMILLLLFSGHGVVAYFEAINNKDDV